MLNELYRVIHGMRHDGILPIKMRIHPETELKLVDEMMVRNLHTTSIWVNRIQGLEYETDINVPVDHVDMLYEPRPGFRQRSYIS